MQKQHMNREDTSIISFLKSKLEPWPILPLLIFPLVVLIFFFFFFYGLFLGKNLLKPQLQ